MIIQHTSDNQYIVFTPETIPERKTLENIPGFFRQGLNIYIPNKQNVIHNLYSRVNKKIKGIKYTKEIKALLDSKLEFKELPDDFKFYTEPLAHQLIALRFGYTFKCFGLLLEPGLGKTKVILDFIWLIKAKRSLIICPKSLRFVWEDEAVKHRPELKVYVIESTNWEKEVEGILSADVVVVNYDKAVSLEEVLGALKFDFLGVDEGLIKNPSSDRTKAVTRLSKGIPYRSIMSGTLVNNSPLDIFAPVRMIEPSLVGESFYKFKEEYALVSRHNRNIVVGYKNIQEVKDILGSCSIIMKKEEWLKDLPSKEFKHIYVQMDDQQRDYYTKLANNYLLVVEELGVEIEVDNPLTVLIKLTQISNGFLYYEENQEESLGELYGENSTPKSKVRRKTHFFKTQPKAEALLKLISSKEFNFREVGDLEKSNGIRRVLYRNTDTGRRDFKYNYYRKDSPKNTIGKSYLPENTPLPNQEPLLFRARPNTRTNTLSSKRAIIWFNMAAELEIITHALREGNHSFLSITGGDKDIGRKVHTFNNTPSIRFLICQSKTINYGVTIMGSEKEAKEDIVPEFDSIVSDQIFYSLNFSLEIFLQQQDRIHRIGQKRKCRYWMLLTNSPIERRIASRLEEKLLCNREILVDILKTSTLKEVTG